MKNIFKYLIIISFGVFLFTSCEEDAITISEKIVGFDGNLSGSIEESSSSVLVIPVYNAAASGAGCTVTFSLSTEGIDNPAIEGTDFNVINSSNTLTFANYYSTDTIYIDAIDNDLYDRNKTVNIVLSNPTNGFELSNESIFELSVIDNEHPLALVIGIYSMTYSGYWDKKSSNFVEKSIVKGTYNVTTTPDPEDETKLIVSGIVGGADDVSASVDLDAMTITFERQPVGDHAGYGETDLTSGVPGTGGVSANTAAIVGTIDSDGTIHVDNFGFILTSGDYAGYWWDFYLTSVWTK